MSTYRVAVVRSGAPVTDADVLVYDDTDGTWVPSDAPTGGGGTSGAGTVTDNGNGTSTIDGTWRYIIPTLDSSPSAGTMNRLAINAAIAEAAQAGGGVYLPGLPGGATWRLDGPLNYVQGVPIRGDGSTRTMIQQISTTADGITAPAGTTDIQLEGLRLIGPGKGVGSGRGLAFLLDGGSPVQQGSPFSNLRDVRTREWGSHGVYLENTYVTHLDRVYSDNNGGDGIHLIGVNVGGTSTTLTSCYGLNNAGAGHHLDRMHYSSLISCAADKNDVGYRLDKCQGTTLISAGCETARVGIHMTDCSAVGVLGFWEISVAEVGIDVGVGCQQITLDRYRENAPPAGKTASIQVAANTKGTLDNYYALTAVLGLTAYWKRRDTRTEPVGTNGDGTVEGRIAAIRQVLQDYGMTW